jgi:signal transduction histidine kinase
MRNTAEQDVSAVARIDSVEKILEVVCRITGLGFSAVARVTDARWIACAVRDEISFGLRPGGELPLKTTICDAIRQTGDPVVINHAATDPVYHDHQTPKIYGFESYISYPIHLPDGRFFGTLCAIDPKPAKVQTPEVLGMFKLFADLIAMHLDAHDRIAASEHALLTERATSQLREQFIAVLGHDLRNPLGAINMGVEVLRLTSTNGEDVEMLELIRRSAGRMGELIANLMDFARGRLGGGLSLSTLSDCDLGATLEHVVAELRAGWPGREIRLQISASRPVPCDAARIGQMVSNLIANALAHGDPAGPVVVRAECTGTDLELSVTNRGPTIPPDIMRKLFEPFARGSATPGQQGLGLGLYICDEIAKAHRGTLSVTSADGETRFTFKMPI